MLQRKRAAHPNISRIVTGPRVPSERFTKRRRSARGTRGRHLAKCLATDAGRSLPEHSKNTYRPLIPSRSNPKHPVTPWVHRSVGSPRHCARLARWLEATRNGPKHESKASRKHRSRGFSSPATALKRKGKISLLLGSSSPTVAVVRLQCKCLPRGG